MKTSEFIKYFEDKGYKIMFDDYCDKSVLFINENHEVLLCVLKGDRIDTDYCAFNDLDQSKKQKYYQVIFEYLMTPPEEREEEKKYKLQQKGVSKKYLIWLNELSEYTTGIYPYKNENVKTVFTQEEIDNMPECYKHPAVWEQIEVECEE